MIPTRPRFTIQAGPQIINVDVHHFRTAGDIVLRGLEVGDVGVPVRVQPGGGGLNFRQGDIVIRIGVAVGIVEFKMSGSVGFGQGGRGGLEDIVHLPPGLVRDRRVLERGKEHSHFIFPAFLNDRWRRVRLSRPYRRIEFLGQGDDRRVCAGHVRVVPEPGFEERGGQDLRFDIMGLELENLLARSGTR